MHNKIKILQLRIVFILTLVLFLSQNVLGGAWTQKKGTAYFKLSLRYLSGDKFYDEDGIKQPTAKLSDFTIGLFGAYGLCDDLTIFMNASPFKSIKFDAPEEALHNTKESGFGDISTGVKYRLAKFGSTVISTKLILNVSIGKSEINDGLWIGSGDFNQAIGLDIGHSFYPLPLYVTGGITFRNRTEGFSDEFNYLIEGGYKLLRDLSVVVRFHGQLSLKNGNADIKGGFGTYSNNQQYIAYNASLVYKINKILGVSGTYESGTNGRNIISAPVYTAGVFITI